MDIILYSKGQELPLADNYHGANFLFPGAELKVAKGKRKSYCYIFQQFKTKFFTIRYCCFYSLVNDILTVVTNTPGVTFRMAISHSHHMITKDLGNQTFHERSNNFFYAPDRSTEYPMEANETFIFLDILPTKDYLLYLQYYFPVMAQLIDNAAEGVAGRLNLNNKIALAEAWVWQQELGDWCFDVNRISSDGDIIGSRLIEKCILSVSPDVVKRNIALTLQETNRICDIAEMISSSKEVYTIQMLAAISGLSVYKLSTGFKEIFGYSLLKHKLEEKMLTALRLLNCNDVDLQQMTTLLGYNEDKIFLRDFRKRFGYTPFEKQKPAP